MNPLKNIFDTQLNALKFQSMKFYRKFQNSFLKDVFEVSGTFLKNQ